MKKKEFPERAEEFMRMALREAKKYSGLTGTNPLVGCIITENNRRIAKGVHKGPGTLHAEIEAVRNFVHAGGNPKNAILYVNLEPCTVFGKTPPCTGALVQSGIANVVVGCLDRNPRVQGKGLHDLKTAGVRVISGVLEKECVELNRKFFKFIGTGEPFVTLKIAMSMDGKIAARRGGTLNGENTITSYDSRKYLHYLRLEHDAVLTGIGTVLSDDPRLTIRYMNKPAEKKLYRVLCDSKLRISLHANMLKNCMEYPVLIATTRCGAASKKRAQLEKMGVQVAVFPQDRHGICMRDLLRFLGKLNIVSVLVEGGSAMNHTFITQKLADSVMLFVSPKLLGVGKTVPAVKSMEGVSFLNKLKLEDVVAKKSGCDILMEGILR